MISFEEFLRTQSPINESASLTIKLKEVSVDDSIDVMMMKNKDCNDMGAFLRDVGELIGTTTYDVVYRAIKNTEDLFHGKFRPSVAVKDAHKCMMELERHAWKERNEYLEAHKRDLRNYKAHRLIDQLDISPKKTWVITPKNITVTLEPWDGGTGADKAKAKKWDVWLKNLYNTIGTKYNEMIVKSLTSKNLYYWLDITKDYQKLIQKMNDYLWDVSSKFEDELEKLK